MSRSRTKLAIPVPSGGACPIAATGVVTTILLSPYTTVLQVDPALDGNPITFAWMDYSLNSSFPGIQAVWDGTGGITINRSGGGWPYAVGQDILVNVEHAP